MGRVGKNIKEVGQFHHCIKLRGGIGFSIKCLGRFGNSGGKLAYVNWKAVGASWLKFWMQVDKCWGQVGVEQFGNGAKCPAPFEFIDHLPAKNTQ
jgi:hypothetical protein